MNHIIYIIKNELLLHAATFDIMTKLAVFFSLSSLHALSLLWAPCWAWVAPFPIRVTQHATSSRPFTLHSTATTLATDIEQSVDALKTVLSREYISFFDPMEKEYYSQDVQFIDPLTSLTGVDSYQSNVDMLASRTLLGKILFRDAGILLHKIEGGNVQPDGSISDIITRWTLRMTVKLIPWTPTARFSGISVYKVSQGGSMGVIINQQNDYWDSINIQNDGGYKQVDKSLALQDFLDQLSPDNLQAPSAAPELPYQLLRRGKDYEIRRYPSYTGVEAQYSRRDEGYEKLDYLTDGKKPLAPALMTVLSEKKIMQWPLEYALPGQSSPPKVSLGDRLENEPGSRVVSVPEQVVAVGSFKDASLEPIVRRADGQLRDALKRDGIRVPADDAIMFAQYDAVFSVGQRRGEVWIPLPDGSHPW